MKTKRLGPGYYKVLVGERNFTINKVEGLQNWYWQEGSKEVHDWQNSKGEAVLALESWLSEGN